MFTDNLKNLIKENPIMDLISDDHNDYVDQSNKARSISFRDSLKWKVRKNTVEDNSGDNKRKSIDEITDALNLFKSLSYDEEVELSNKINKNLNFDKTNEYSIIKLLYNNSKDVEVFVKTASSFEMELETYFSNGEKVSPEVFSILGRIKDKINSIIEFSNPILSDTPDRNAQQEVVSGPPLPTPDDIPERWNTRQRKEEDPLTFFKRVYAPWVGRMTKADVNRSDPTLYAALNRWSGGGRNTIPEDVLPNAYKRWGNTKVTNQDIDSYRKVNAIMQKNRLF